MSDLSRFISQDIPCNDESFNLSVNPIRNIQNGNTGHFSASVVTDCPAGLEAGYPELYITISGEQSGPYTSLPASIVTGSGTFTLTGTLLDYAIVSNQEGIFEIESRWVARDQCGNYDEAASSIFIGAAVPNIPVISGFVYDAGGPTVTIDSTNSQGEVIKYILCDDSLNEIDSFGYVANDGTTNPTTLSGQFLDSYYIKVCTADNIAGDAEECTDLRRPNSTPIVDASAGVSSVVISVPPANVVWDDEAGSQNQRIKIDIKDASGALLGTLGIYSGASLAPITVDLTGAPYNLVDPASFRVCSTAIEDRISEIDPGEVIVASSTSIPLQLTNSNNAGNDLSCAEITTLLASGPGLEFDGNFYDNPTDLKNAIDAFYTDGTYNLTTCRVDFTGGTPPAFVPVALDDPQADFRLSDGLGDTSALIGGLLNNVIVDTGNSLKYQGDPISVVKQTDTGAIAHFRVTIHEPFAAITVPLMEFDAVATGTSTSLGNFDYSMFTGTPIAPIDQLAIEAALTGDATGGVTPIKFYVNKIGTGGVDSALKGREIDDTVVGTGTDYLGSIGVLRTTDVDGTEHQRGVELHFELLYIDCEGVQSINATGTEIANLGIKRIKSSSMVPIFSMGIGSFDNITMSVGRNDGVDYASNPADPLAIGIDWDEADTLNAFTDDGDGTVANNSVLFSHTYGPGSYTVRAYGSENSDKTNPATTPIGLRYRTEGYLQFPVAVSGVVEGAWLTIRTSTRTPRRSV